MEQGSRLYINLLLWTTLVSFMSAKVQWGVVEQLTDYGQDLTLFCTADGYSISSISTKRWHGGPEHKMLSLNGVAANPMKHNTTVEKEGFRLIIKNFSKTDVNVTYTCTFGFNEFSRVLTEKDAFKSRTVDQDREQQTMQNSDVNLGFILGVILGSLAIIAIILIIRKQRLGKRRHRRGYSNPGEVELQPLNPDGSDSSPTETNVHEKVSTNIQHKYPAYEDDDLRTKSFTKRDHFVSPTELAAAGFFYSGVGCKARCFSCGKLIDWKDGGDPVDPQFHDDCKHLQNRRYISNGISHETSPKSVI